MNDPHDSLIDMLLKEVLSYNRPPDLTGRVLDRIARRERRFWYMGTGAAAAAAAIIIAVMFAISRPATVEPMETEFADYVDPPRNTVIEAETEIRSLVLGDYCLVEMHPGTSVRVEGKPGAEQIFLERGMVVCDIDSAMGGFVVRTAAGRVVVKGTRFSVRVIDCQVPAQIFVEVAEGVVAAIGEWGRQELREGQIATLPEPIKKEVPDLPKIGEPPVPNKPEVEPIQPKPPPEPVPETQPQMSRAVKNDLRKVIVQYSRDRGVSVTEAGREILKQLEDTGTEKAQGDVQKVVSEYAGERGISTEQAEEEIVAYIQKLAPAPPVPETRPRPPGRRIGPWPFRRPRGPRNGRRGMGEHGSGHRRGSR